MCPLQKKQQHVRVCAKYYIRVPQSRSIIKYFSRGISVYKYLLNAELIALRACLILLK